MSKPAAGEGGPVSWDAVAAGRVEGSHPNQMQGGRGEGKEGIGR